VIGWVDCINGIRRGYFSELETGDLTLELQLDYGKMNGDAISALFATNSALATTSRRTPNPLARSLAIGQSDCSDSRPRPFPSTTLFLLSHIISTTDNNFPGPIYNFNK
jgi:hypothetical protein